MPTLEGRIVGAEEKSGGYVRFETDTRPRFLDTKHEKLIDEAYALLDSGEVAVIRYNEVESRNVNERTGQPYTNRYYEGAVTNGRGRDEPEPERSSRRRRPEPEQHQARDPEREQRREPRAPDPEQIGFGYRTHPESAWRMALTSGSERAVQTLPLMPSEQRDFETQKAIALAWAHFIMDTPQSAAAGEVRASTAPGAYDEPPPVEDDDIPF